MRNIVFVYVSGIAVKELSIILQKHWQILYFVDAKKVLLSPLRIKLGLIKIFVRATKQDDPGFKFLKQKKVLWVMQN